MVASSTARQAKGHVAIRKDRHAETNGSTCFESALTAHESVSQGYNYAPALISVGGRKLAAFDGKAAARKLQSVGTAPIRTPKIPTTDDQAELFTQSYGNCAHNLPQRQLL